MAYNRMFLKCRICGEEFMLAKSYGNGFYREDYHGNLLNEFNAFLDKHTFCQFEGDEGDFELEYEMQPWEQFIQDKRKHFISISTEEIDKAMADGKIEDLFNEAFKKAERYIVAHGGVPEVENGGSKMD